MKAILQGACEQLSNMDSQDSHVSVLQFMPQVTTVKLQFWNLLRLDMPRSSFLAVATLQRERPAMI